MPRCNHDYEVLPKSLRERKLDFSSNASDGNIVGFYNIHHWSKLQPFNSICQKKINR